LYVSCDPLEVNETRKGDFRNLTRVSGRSGPLAASNGVREAVAAHRPLPNRAPHHSEPISVFGRQPTQLRLTGFRQLPPWAAVT
jgi:hypothetical protein